MATGPGSHSC